MNSRKSGFTLIELSIVLVIIGLIVGGVLVGRDLIGAAAVRAQVSQIGEYQAAINTFKLKYGYLPGDIRDPEATNFGFSARGIYGGTGDGNEILEGIFSYFNGSNYGWFLASGENGLLWRDLSFAKIIKESNFTSATAESVPTVGGTSVSLYIPNARIENNFIYTTSFNGINYFGLAKVPSINGGTLGAFSGGASVKQAYAIDSKLDDGIPGTGNIIAAYFGAGGTFYWADTSRTMTLSTNATAASATSCFDNNNSAGISQNYSTSFNNGNGTNCPLSIKMK